MKQYLVSIIMPAYNAEKNLKETIESVISQTYNNWELLVADNNSTDRTAEIVKEYSLTDSRVKYIKAFDKEGAGYARNMAINEAKGRFIAFLDSDDLWLKTKLEEQIPFMLKNKLALSYTTYQSFGDNSYIIKNVDSVDYEGILKHNPIGCLTAVYDIERLGRKYYMPEIRNGQDWCLWTSILKDSKTTAKRVDSILSKYRVEEGSLSSNKLKSAYFHYKGLRDVLKVGRLKTIYVFSIYVFINIKRLIMKKCGLSPSGMIKI